MELKIEQRPVTRLIPYAGNPRTHGPAQIAQIAASIREFGFVNPVLIGPDSIVIAGHGRLAAARQLGLAEVPVIELAHLTETQRQALVIADNRIALNAGWDEELLRTELMSLHTQNFKVESLGFADRELVRLLEAEQRRAGLTDEDAAPDPPPEAVTLPGDVWLLGPHRVACGDSTQGPSLAAVMDGERADLVFTDPPYNVAYTGYTEDRLTIPGDSLPAAQFVTFLEAAFLACRQNLKAGASVYVCHASVWQREVQNALEAAGFCVRCQIIWAKNTFAWGFGRYKFQHEPIFYGHVADQTDSWYGDRCQSTLWQENKPTANRLHPTMKPVELMERALVNSSKSGDLVLDPFGGSGSTLIACERRGRQARLVEIGARYCDVIVKRWQDFTGQTATLQDGQLSFREAQERRLPGQPV